MKQNKTKAAIHHSTIAFCVIALTGCSFGMQYVQPSPGEPTAELVVGEDTRDLWGKLNSNTTLKIINSGKDGCYAGYTGLDYEDKINLYAGRPVVISVEKGKRNKPLCSATYAFTPEADAKYLMSSNNIDRCDLMVNKVVNERVDHVSLKHVALKSGGFGCIKFTW